MNTRKPRLYVLMAVGLVLALLLGSIPGIKAMAQDVTPAADPIPTFTDVPVSHWAYSYIETLYNAGVTTGCSTSPLKYCPNSEVTRAQMAIFLLKAEHGSDYVPPAASGTLFSDVPADYWAVDWIEQLATEEITTGCAAGMYCPQNGVTRAQMAVFLLKGKYGSDYVPPIASGTMFSDVPSGYWAADWIEQLATEGITTGCGEGIYCPQNVVTRAQMAVFLVKAFDLVDPRGVAAEDFGVVNGPEVIGYNVGWHLVDAVVSDTTSIVVKLYNGTTELATATATAKVFTDFPDATQLSAPFDVLGTFNYETDGYWEYTGWAGEVWTLPTKAEITVTFKNGVVRTAENTDLTGDTSIFFLGDVAAEDFGVVNGPEVIGYNVGWHLVDAVVSDTTSIVVKLYNGTTELATATSTAKVFTDFPDATQLSAPFDVLGTFNYETDGYWTYSGWSGFTSVIPDKAEITVTFKNGLVKMANNTMLTGDTSIFTKGDVVAEDFGVYVNEEINLKGYSVGFGLVDAVASDVTDVVVKLYNGTTELATATATGLMANYPTATDLSAPFDVAGTFDYASDGNWSYSGWLVDKIVLPDMAEITVTFANGLVKTDTIAGPSGDVSIFAPVLTEPATDITPAEGRMNALTGPDAVAGRTFWVSAAPIIIPDSHNRPAGVFSTIDKGALAAYTPYSILISTVTDLLPITANTTYYYVAWVKIDGIWYHGEVMSFTTLP